MEKLTEQLKAKFNDYLNDIMGDFDEQEIKNCRDILNESEGGRFSELDNTLLTRIIDDEELIEIIEKLTDKSEEKNAFD